MRKRRNGREIEESGEWRGEREEFWEGDLVWEEGQVGIWRHGGWFEAMNGDRILFGANLEEEGMGRTAEDFVRTRVGRSEWWVRRWGAD
jgi:hypothetical protein